MTNDKEDRSARPMISGAPEGYVLTVADMRDALSNFSDNAEIAFSTCAHGTPLQFYRFKKRGDDVLGIEFS